MMRWLGRTLPLLMVAILAWGGSEAKAQQPGPGAKPGAGKVEKNKDAVREARKEVREAVVKTRSKAKEVAREMKADRAELKAKLAETRERMREQKGKARAQRAEAAAAADGDERPGARRGRPGVQAGRARAEARRAARMRAWKRLKARLGGRLSVPAAMRSELKVHARRMARLGRVKAIAEMKQDEKAAARVAELIEKEKQRHEKHMEKLTARVREGEGAQRPEAADEGAKAEGEEEKGGTP